jgi:pimeloyl-ACP methyl ester carboxylesterase
MARPPEGQAPIVDTATAVSDLAKVVEYIQSRRNVDKVSLVGWSWGATVATVYATESAYGRVDRLVLYAPQWLRSQPEGADLNPESLGAWRLMHPEGARDRWLKDVPEAKRAAILPKPRFDQWLRATLDSDPVGAVSSPAGVRAPNGSAADTLRYWMAGKPRFDAAKVGQPVLVIQGEWDGECPPAMGQALFARLDRSVMKRYVMIGEATHALLLEKNRIQLFTAVEQFLQEPLP